MLDIPSISAVVAAVGVTLGVTLAYLEVRTLVKTRQTDLVIRLYSTFGSRDFQEDWHRVMGTEYRDYNDFVKKYGRRVAEAGLFFEGVGVLLKRDLIDIALIEDLFGGAVKLYWEKRKHVVEDAREQLNLPQFGEWFEYLYNEMQRREQSLQQTQQ